MTTNEKQELNVLSIFIDHKIDRFSSMKFPKEITDALGGGSEAIIKNLIRDGMINDTHNFEYEFNKTGKARYVLLKNIKKGERINSWAFWIIFITSIISAAYAIISYHFSGKTKSEPASKPTIEKTLQVTTPTQSLISDTIKVQKIDTSHY